MVWPPEQRQSARAAIAELMRERGLGRRFERHVQREAGRARDRVGAAQASAPGRRDLRELATFTIDPLSARDFDDAISAQALPGGGNRVWVHIADVSAYVKEGSSLDREARRRATSVYAPGTVEPMLPPALSNEACSLVPESDRLAVTVELELQGSEVRHRSFYRSLIRSDARLDYGRVDRVFAGSEPAAEPWRAPLAAARDAAAALAAQREHRGALVIDTQEPEFTFDRHGEVREIRARSQTEAHRLIEQLMIAANEAVAQRLEQRGVPSLYRVHERPDPEAVLRLADQLASLEVPTPPLPERPSPSQAESLMGEISRLLDAHVRRTGHGRMGLGSLVLRSLKQAYYSPRNVGHSGLRSPCYCHFTSPIRRYPDLVCHRALLSTLESAERAPRPGELAELGAWCSEQEREAMTIERDGDDVASCFALERVLYEGGFEQTFAGEVVGLIGAGAFIAFGPAAVGDSDEPPAGSQATQDARGMHVYEGMLPVRRLRGAPGSESAGAWWELNELGTILRSERTGGALRLGDELAVQVVRIDAPRGRVELMPVPAERG